MTVGRSEFKLGVSTREVEMSNVMESEAGLDGRRVRGQSLKWGVAAVGAAVVVDVYGVYGGPVVQPDQKAGLPFVIAVAAVAAGVVFGAAVPRVLRGNRDADRRRARPGLVLSILGVVLVPVAFWSGIPLVLGAGGWLVGSVARVEARSTGTSTSASTAAVALGVLAVFATLIMVALSNTVFSS